MAVLHHAPVTAACLCTVFATSTALSSSILSIVLKRSVLAGSAAAGVLPATTSVMVNAVLTTFPMVPCYPAGWSFICLMIVMLHYRHLERQWGSARYLTFVATASVLGRVLAQITVPGSAPAADATRVVTLLALIFPLAALSTRYHLDIPSLPNGGMPVALRRWGISETSIVPAMTLVLLLRSAPSVMELQGVPRTPVQPVAVWLRLAVAACGVVFGYATKRQQQRKRRGGGSLAVRAMDWVSTNVSSKLVKHVFVPLLTPLCGPATTIVHHMPPQSPNAGRAPAAARGAVGNLVAGDDDDTIPPEVWAQIVREQQALNAGTPTSPVSPTRRQFPAGNAPPGTATAASRRPAPAAPAVDQAKVAMLRELQLGVSDAAIAEALVVCGGDVENAAAYLMTHHLEG